MTLGNMRANGVRSLDVSCWQCHHRTILSADPWPDHVPVPAFGPRMVCIRGGFNSMDERIDTLLQGLLDMRGENRNTIIEGRA
jgi:hypothetical protein